MTALEGSARGRPGDEPSLDVDGTRITHPGRILYPDCGITKGEIARFYADVADAVLPHIAGRPLSVIRCPTGLDEGAVQAGVHQSGRGSHGETRCFFQKHAKSTTPNAVGRVRVPEARGTATYLAVRDRAGLLSLVQFGTLELHPWGATADRPDEPDRLFFDLDPAPDVAWSAVVEGAREVRRALQDVGLESFVKTTGGKGLHVVVPLAPATSWDLAKRFSRALAERLAAADPSRYVATMSRSRRGGRIFVDYLRNVRGATAVAAFSTRARPGAPVSTPLAWSELGSSAGPSAYGVRNLRKRLRRLGTDPWSGFFEAEQSIEEAMVRELEG